MKRSKLGLKALGLCALVVGLMAFAASGVAQAETGASWGYINKTTGVLETFTTLKPVLGAKLDSATASLLFTTAGGTKVEFRCTTASLTGSPKLEGSGSISTGAASFTGCKTFLNGAESKNCEPKTNKGAKGTVETNSATGLIKLHLLTPNGTVDPTVLLTPSVTNAKGETLATTLELGELCSIGETVEVTGDLTVVDCNNEFTTHKVEHLIEEFSALRGLKALGQPATIDGSALAFLTLEHKELKWAGLPSATKP